MELLVRGRSHAQQATLRLPTASGRMMLVFRHFENLSVLNLQNVDIVGIVGSETASQFSIRGVNASRLVTISSASSAHTASQHSTLRHNNLNTFHHYHLDNKFYPLQSNSQHAVQDLHRRARRLLLRFSSGSRSSSRHHHSWHHCYSWRLFQPCRAWSQRVGLPHSSGPHWPDCPDHRSRQQPCPSGHRHCDSCKAITAQS